MHGVTNWPKPNKFNVNKVSQTRNHWINKMQTVKSFNFAAQSAGETSPFIGRLDERLCCHGNLPKIWLNLIWLTHSIIVFSIFCFVLHHIGFLFFFVVAIFIVVWFKANDPIIFGLFTMLARLYFSCSYPWFIEIPKNHCNCFDRLRYNGRYFRRSLYIPCTELAFFFCSSWTCKFEYDIIRPVELARYRL